MHTRRSTLGFLMVGALWPLQGAAQSDALGLLSQFLMLVKSGRAQFSQAVTSVPKAGQEPRVRVSSGALVFLRPGRFRFSYVKPFEQVMVADGQTLWLHDMGLRQITARAQAQALASAPLALMTSASQLSALQAQFDLKPEPSRDGLQWVRATPRQAEGPIRHALMGLRASDRGPVLGALDVWDALGQRSLLTFTGWEVNAAVAESEVQFHPPAGVDVLRV